MKKFLLIFILVFIIPISAYLVNKPESNQISSCISCHQGIEEMSPTHTDISCTQCHGGNDKAADKDIAHTDMIGGKNPASPKVWDKTCGTCHEHQMRRVTSSVMLTNTGIIKNTLEAWGESDPSLYTHNELSTAFAADGKPITIKDVKSLTTVAADMYRKFCSACHLSEEADMGYVGTHSSGCSACHFPHNEFGEYEGKDTQMVGRSPYPATHAMQALPPDEACAVCHNRSGRIALSYKGLYDGNNSLVPTKDGIPGPELTSGLRNLRHMKSDIHFQRGMECIDCHTSSEIMGDGYYYDNMYNQIEISCESCHGSPTSLPKTEIINREYATPLIESKSYKTQITFGQEMVLTDKGRMYSNVYKKNDEYILMSKRSGKERTIKTITNTGEHKVTGHDRLECYSCHSSAVIQCYGCHVEYDERQLMHDYIKGEDTPGLFTETEDLRTFYPFPLAVDQRDKISPVTPGCQTFLTHIDKDGNKIKDEYILDFRGTKKLKFAPFFGHNVGEKAVGCADCHGDAMFYGFGGGLFSAKNKTLTAPAICDGCDIPLVPIYFIDNGTFKVSSDVVRVGSRTLNKIEISNMINANKCIVCHEKGESKYYGGEIDYEKILNDNTHKPLLN